MNNKFKRRKRNKVVTNEQKGPSGLDNQTPQTSKLV